MVNRNSDVGLTTKFPPPSPQIYALWLDIVKQAELYGGAEHFIVPVVFGELGVGKS